MILDLVLHEEVDGNGSNFAATVFYSDSAGWGRSKIGPKLIAQFVWQPQWQPNPVDTAAVGARSRMVSGGTMAYGTPRVQLVMRSFGPCSL